MRRGWTAVGRATPSLRQPAPGGGFFGARLAVVSDRVKRLIRLLNEGSDMPSLHITDHQ